MRILVTTATFGSPAYEQKWVAQKGDFEVDFKRYTDNNFPSRKNALHPRMKGKIPKMLSHLLNPGYDYYIWLDSRFEISKEDSVEWFIEQCGDEDMAFFKHPNRSSIQQELSFMENLMDAGDGYLIGRYGGEDMRGQVEEYLSDDLFEYNKLFACGAFIYKPTLRVKATLSDWITHNLLESVQDQLSLPYVLQVHDTDYNTIDMNIFDCPYFRYK